MGKLSRLIRTRFIFGGAENLQTQQVELGSGGLAPGKSFMTIPFRLLENNPFLEDLLLKQTKDHN